MRRLYTLLFNITLISSYSSAKAEKLTGRHKAEKSAKVRSSKLIDYEIKRGDTLYSVARKHHSAVEKIMLINGLKEGDALRVGKHLKVPTDTIEYAGAKRAGGVHIAGGGAKREKRSSPEKKLLHTVVKGETLSQIAKNNHTTLKALEKLNSLGAEARIVPGQKLIVPGAERSGSGSMKQKSRLASVKKRGSKSQTTTYRVKKGDSLYRIAIKKHTTVDALKSLNKIKSEKSLKLGQLLILPSSGTKKSAAGIKVASADKKSPKRMLTHTVKKGDSLYKIAKNNHITVEALEKVNKLTSAKKLKLGQVITVPLPASKKNKTEIKIAKTISKEKKIKIASKKKASSEKIVFIQKKRSKKAFLLHLAGGGGSTLKLSAAKRQLGKRYVWGAEGPYTFDCSGFTSYVCKKSGVCLPRRSIDQSKVGKRISRKNLKPGDLIFFDTSRRHRGYVNHVGIYLGHNKFIHASSAKKKVVITSLEKPFYKSRFKWGRRVKG